MGRRRPRRAPARPGRGAARAELFGGRAPAERRPPVALEQVALPAAALAPAARAALAAAVGDEHVRDDHATRVAHAAGRSYPDLVRLRTGDLADRARRRRRPAGRDEVAARAGGVRARTTSRWCPFGGGTSVVGGVEPLSAAATTPSIALDLARLDRRRRRRASRCWRPSAPACSAPRPRRRSPRVG